MAINWNKALQTIDGRPARLLCDNLKSPGRLLRVTAVTIEDGSEIVMVHDEDGICGGQYYVNHRWLGGISAYSNSDLINRRIKHEGWVNLYGMEEIHGGVVYPSKSDAERGSSYGRIATARIEWETDE